MKFPYILGANTVHVDIDGTPYSSDRSSPRWNDIKVALDNPDTTADEMIELLSPAVAIRRATANQPLIAVENGVLLFNGQEVHGALAKKIMDLYREGLSLDPWVKFAINVYANPEEFSREELYLFLEHAELPITEDGCFLAYKKIRNDYTDIHSGQFDNSVGQLVAMDRSKVDKDRYRTCSTGFHFCSKGYLPKFGNGSGNRVVVVKINPADVVSIPADYNNTKGRCWKFEVVAEIPEDLAATWIWPASVRVTSWDDSVDGDPGYYDDEDDWDFDEEWPEAGAGKYWDETANRWVDPDVEIPLVIPEVEELENGANYKPQEIPVVDKKKRSWLGRIRRGRTA